MTEVTVSSSIPRWAQRFRALLPQLNAFLAAQMQTNRGFLFLHSGSYNGHEAWKPPKLRDGQPLRDKGTLMKSIGPITRAKTGRVQPIRNEGTFVKYGLNYVTVGTTLKKARILNDGGVIVPKKKKLLWIPLSTNKNRASEAVTKAIAKHKHNKKAGNRGQVTLGGAPIVRLPNGKFFMLAKKVVIPPRPFDKVTKQDRDEIAFALTEEVSRCLNREK